VSGKKKYLYIAVAKAFAFLGVFVFAKFLDKENVGTIAYYQSVQFFLIPLLSFQLPTAIFRFFGESRYKGEIKNAVLLGNYFAYLSVFFFFAFLYTKNLYVGVAATTLAYIALNVSLEYLRRAKGDNQYFFIMMIQSVLFVFGACVLIVALNGYGFESVLMAEYGSVMLVWFVISISKKIGGNLCKIKKLLRYSVPLIPNSVCWWLLNSGMVYLITQLLGAEHAGVFSLNYKIPSFLIVLSGMIVVVWQGELLALFNNNKLSKAVITKKTYHFFFISIALATVLQLATNVFLLNFYENYYVSTFFILKLGVISLLYAFNAYLGIQYILSCNTKRASFVMLVGSALTMLSSLFLGYYMGIDGIIYAYIIGLSLMLLLRYYDYLNWREQL